jgi:hypothetical protein
MNQQPFTLHIFVANGDPDGLRVIERTNWVGKAILFPRTLLPVLLQSRSEFRQTGVYLLLGPRDNSDGDMLYIGEGDPVGPRLKSHYEQKDFWNRAVFFVASNNQINKAHVQFLEAQLIALATTAKRLPLDNKNQPSQPTLSESDQAYMNVFLDHLLGILPALGIHAFDAVSQRPIASLSAPITEMRSAPELLTCVGKGITATGYESTQGFVVKQGSEIVEKTAPSMATGIHDLRQHLIQSGVVTTKAELYFFTQDYPFSSPSTAASVILGRNANGRVEWKDSAGKTLKTIQLAAMAQPSSATITNAASEDLL